MLSATPDLKVFLMTDHKFGFNFDGKEVGIKIDDSKISEAMKDARESLGLQAFAPKPDHELRNVGIAAGTGFAGGAALTALGEIGLMKVAEPIARPLGALAFGLLGGGRAASAIMSAPKLTALECLTPKPILIGGLVVAGLATAGYELYEHVIKK
jgi:hypothetical protein